MATLISPGVDVQIINEVYTDTVGPGTVPLVVIATASDKLNPSGSGIAPLTTASTAGKVQTMTSQRELLASFGNPYFWSNQGTPLHGYELNEYGLHTAWSILGAQDRCLVLRAPVDLAALAPSRSAPTSAPANGTYWFDYDVSRMGVFVSDGNAVPGYAWSKAAVLFTTANDVDVSNIPKTGFGANGNFAIVTQTTANYLYEKTAGTWNRVGSSAWKTAHPTIVEGTATPSTVSGTISINGTSVAAFSAINPAACATAINNASITNITASTNAGHLVITNTAGGNIVLANVSGTALATLGLTAGTTKGLTLTFTNNASYPADSVAGDIWIKMTAPAEGTNFVLKRYSATTATWSASPLIAYAFDATLTDGDANKDAAATAGFGSSLKANTVYLGYHTNGTRQFRIWSATAGWTALVYEASLSAPTLPATEGTLWFSPDFEVDIMVGDGQNWRGYTNYYAQSDEGGVILAGSAPEERDNGDPLGEHDLWIDTSDLENYPALYRYNATTSHWGAVDLSDQSTPFGIVFADARQDSGVAFTGQVTTGYTYNSTETEDMLQSDYVDPDAPDARAYPAGTLLFNTRYSTYNVKEWRPNHFKLNGFDPNTNYLVSTYEVGGDDYTFPALEDAGRWVTVSGNKLDGSPYMGRKAQRAMITRSIQGAIASCEEIRSEMFYYTLIATPGYPELIDEMVSLNVDQSEISTIVADVPARIHPSKVDQWASNARNAGENGDDGLVTGYDYLAIYWGWGLSTNVDGNKVMVPPSTMALRAYLYNDRVGQVWFAPAGDERGIVTNAESVGYLSAEEEFVPVVLNTAQRNLMAVNKINPIVQIPNVGLRLMGQKTMAASAGPLDRVQGARLANYLRYHLKNLMRPFLFQQNDSQTRGTAEITVSRFFNGLTTLRAISDYAVLADETNNTKERQARHELWVDCAVQPIFAIEFIYIPCRFRDTGIGTF